MKKKKVTKRKLVPRTRNMGTWTESMYWSQIRSFLRKAFMYWRPMQKALDDVKRPSKNSKLKWEYQCSECSDWFARKDVNIDHIIPCGSLRSFEDIESFIKRLTPEDPEAYNVLCKTCHQAKTNEERNGMVE